MKKKCIGVLLSALALTVLLKPVTAQANSEYEEALAYYYDDYYIDSLDIVMDVNEDNTFHITEKYVYNFIEPHHGPTRSFIESHTRLRADGSEDTIRATVKHIKVSSPDAVSDIADTSTDYDDGTDYKTIKVGDEDETYTGVHEYEISYDYIIKSRDPLIDADELYYNIVGTGYECPINYVTWTINMPKDFDESRLGYSVGFYSTEGYNIDYLYSDVNGKTITGEYTNALLPYEGITVRLLLDEGYFTYRDYSIVGYIIIAIVTILSSIYFFIKPGKKPVEVVEFYPPDGMNPVDVEVIYTGIAPKKVIALLPYLANRGYFKIIQVGKVAHSFQLQNTDFTLLDKEEKLFIKGMFKNLEEGETVTDKELKKQKFYTVIEKIVSKYFEKAQNQFDSKSLWRAALGYFIAIVSYLLIGMSTAAFISHTDVLECLIGLLFIGWLPLAELLSTDLSKKSAIIIRLVIAAVGFPIYACIIDNFFTAFIATALTIALFISARSKIQRKQSTLETYGKVLGFRNFIKTAELDRLKMLCDENPNYFYDTIAYAYALGLESKWIKTFEELAIHIPEPDWYVGLTPFPFNSFNKSFDRMMTHERTSIASSPNSGGNSGGGYSGGGFSGGGSGGGGGGAW